MSTWGDAFIISADRYSVYDPTARKDKINQLKDETGLIGKGPLHIEAEWDSDSSDVFEKALAEMGTRIETAKKALAASPAPSATEKAKLQKELTTTKADLKKLTGMRDTIRKDIAAIVQVAKDQLVGAGLTLDTEKKSKDERANEIADSTKRPVYWP